MKKILLLIFLMALLFNPAYPQDDEIGDALFEYCVDRIGDLNALIYLYKSENKNELVTIEQLGNYVVKNDLNISFEAFKNLRVDEDSSNNLIISFELMPSEEVINLTDSVKIEKVSSEIHLNRPISEGSSIRTVSGKIKNGVVQLINGDQIEVNEHKFTNVLFIRVDISEIRHLKLKLSNEFEPGTPEWVFRESSNKLKAGDYASFASFTIMEELELFKSLFIEAMNLDSTNQIINTFYPEVENTDDLEQLSPQEFLSDFYNAFFKSNPEYVESQINIKSKVLGKVFENEDLCHIITRNTRTMEGNDLSVIDVKSLKKVDGTWYMTLQDELVQMAYKLKQNLRNR